tara:strand:- start:2504 stop:3790 length:1287 start_codon:yes stop_codon:yes gene_type:complete
MEENINQEVPQEQPQTEQPPVEKKFPILSVVAGVAVILLAVAGWFVYSSTQNKEEGAVRDYVGNSPEECTLIQVTCIEGLQRFDDENGCGCEEGAILEDINLVDTSNWQTYSNEKFSVEYPPNWFSEEKVTNYNRGLYLLRKEYTESLGTEGFAKGEQISVSQWGRGEGEYYQGRSDEELISMSENGGDYMGPLTKKELVINDNGVQMHRIEHSNEGHQQTLQYLILDQTNLYKFFLYPYEDGDTNHKEFEKMVGTFKFNEKIENGVADQKNDGENTTTFPETIESTQYDSEGLNINITSTFKPTVTTSISGNSETTEDCGYEGCFEDKFRACEKAYKESNSSSFGGISYVTEILGKKSGLCEVKSHYTNNPNPLWINKEMDCLYDNSKDFDTASQEVFLEMTDLFNDVEGATTTCSGELFDIMKDSS